MKISYLITTHNEGKYISDLMTSILLSSQLDGDEIVIIDDYSNDNETKNIINAYINQPNVKVYEHHLNRNFAEHKNFGNSKCTGDFIFQLDADEIPPAELIKNIHSVIQNTNVDLIVVPRINIVDGLTDDDIRMWGWKVNEQGWVMFPDYQSRIYKNDPNIKWYGNVHETIIGHKTVAYLPAEETWSIKHFKSIERQRSQNRLYQEMMR